VLNQVWILLNFLAEMNPIEAMEVLLDHIKETKNKKLLEPIKD
jgi:transcription termination factor Rho